MDSDGNQDQATNQEELSPQDNDIISLQVLKDDFLPGLPTPDFTPEQTPELIQEPTPAGPFRPLTREICRVYINNIIAICRRENVLKL